MTGNAALQPALTLVIGGIRSGKSELGERLVGAFGERVAYLATGSAGDAEMQSRIEAHRSRRSKRWITVEASSGLADELAPIVGGVQAVLLDDLSGLATSAVLTYATMDDAEAWIIREEQALWSLSQDRNLPIVAVTSEVGFSLVPVSDLGRRYADLMGELNQRWAARASVVYLIVAGIPLQLK